MRCANGCVHVINLLILPHADQSLVAWDLASVALLAMCDRLVSWRKAGSSPGGVLSAAAFAQVSAASLPCT